MKLKKIISIILTVSIVSTSFPLIVQAGEQTEEAVIQVAQEVEEIGDEVQALPKPEYEDIEDKMQTAPKPAEITDYFNINSKEKFIEFMTTPKYHASNWETTLLCDIDMEGSKLESIDRYYGRFNGEGHVVSNMSFDCFVKNNHGYITGITFSDCKQIKRGYVSSFVINNEKDGTIENCLTTMDSISDNNVAGFVIINEGLIYNCMALGDVTGSINVSGFAIHNYGGIISNCTAGGKVNGKGNVRRFVCENKGGTITNCKVTGKEPVKVSGKEKVGGFVGYITYGAIITKCKATVDVTGHKHVGGFVGIHAEMGGFIGIDSSEMAIESKAARDTDENINARGNIINCHSIGNVTVRGNDVLDIIGNGKVLDSKKVETFILTVMILSTGFIAGLIKAI